MMDGKLEECCICCDPTGNAGRGDGSIYCDVCDSGPFCSDCAEDETCPICGAEL